MEVPTTPTGSQAAALERIRPLILPSNSPPEVVDLTQDDEEVRHVSDTWNDTFEWEEEEEATTHAMDMDEDINWPIHQGYACYSLYDVAVEADLDTLEQWLKLFTPSTQPRSEEEFFYVQCMASAISEKIQQLKSRS